MAYIPLPSGLKDFYCNFTVIRQDNVRNNVWECFMVLREARRLKGRDELNGRGLLDTRIRLYVVPNSVFYKTFNSGTSSDDSVGEAIKSCSSPRACNTKFLEA